MCVRNSDGGVAPKAREGATGTERKVMADNVENTRAGCSFSVRTQVPKNPSVWERLRNQETREVP